VSAAVSTYINNGFMDILQNKWFSDLPCVNRQLETSDIGQPTPLGVDAFLGVFLMLGFGILGGAIILCLEHAFYRYALPILRQKPPDSMWRNPNIMFVSQVCRTKFSNTLIYHTYLFIYLYNNITTIIVLYYNYCTVVTNL